MLPAWSISAESAVPSKLSATPKEIVLTLPAFTPMVSVRRSVTPLSSLSMRSVNGALSR